MNKHKIFVFLISFRIYDIQGAKQLHCFRGSVSEEGNLIKVIHMYVCRGRMVKALGLELASPELNANLSLSEVKIYYQ